MGTTTIRQRAVRFLEQKLTHEGRILAVRSWDHGGLYEIDLHLPDVANMENWHKAQRIIVRVAPLTFRDYTPASWDAATKTCTLYIDAFHEGPGARWAASAKAGEMLSYVGIDGASHQAIDPKTPAVFLGDASAIGQFLAFRQIAGPAQQILGAIYLEEAAHRAAFHRTLSELPLDAVSSEAALYQWVEKAAPPQDAAWYLVGRSKLVADLRRSLRALGYKQIKAQGFWK
jgi:NADPH-dependent ferric siderophore reductase